jgi:beta-glucosidase
VFKQNHPNAISVLAGLRAKVGKSMRIDYSEGVRMPARLYPSPFGMIDGTPPPKPPLDETAEIQRATELARGADVAVLVLGEGQNMIGETASRSSLDLPGRQLELLDAVVGTGKPVIVLLMSARPLDLKDTKAGAIMDIWYPGSEGGQSPVRRRHARRQVAFHLDTKCGAGATHLRASDFARSCECQQALLERIQPASLPIRLRAELHEV